MEQDIKNLILKKDQIQEKIRKLDLQIESIAQSKSYNEKLVDDEGYPRPDLDFGQLANYRSLKRQKAQLNNDHLVLMKQIQKGLFLLHSSYKQNHNQQENQNQIEQSQSFKKQKHKVYTVTQTNKKQNMKKQQMTEISQSNSKIDYLTPFAKISLVSQNSPASLGGIKASDLLSEFGQVNIYSMNGIKQIPKHVKEGLQIRIILLRKQQQTALGDNIFVLKDGNKYRKIQCKIIPKKWDGAGLLGCKIDPLIKQ